MPVITSALKTAKASLTHDEAEDLLTLVLSSDDSKESLHLLEGLPCIPLIGGRVGVLKAQGGVEYHITSHKFCSLLSDYPFMINPHSKSFEKLHFWATDKSFFNISLMTPQVIADNMEYLLPSGWKSMSVVKPPFVLTPIAEGDKKQQKEVDVKWLSAPTNKKKRGKGKNPVVIAPAHNNNSNNNDEELLQETLNEYAPSLYLNMFLILTNIIVNR